MQFRIISYISINNINTHVQYSICTSNTVAGNPQYEFSVKLHYSQMTFHISPLAMYLVSIDCVRGKTVNHPHTNRPGTKPTAVRTDAKTAEGWQPR